MYSMRGGGKLAVAVAGVAAIGVGVASNAAAHVSAKAAGSKGTITVCVIAAQTGATANLGVGVAHGANAWGKYENAHGGLLGDKVNIVQENDNSTASTAAMLVRKCVTQDHAQFIIGPEEGSEVAASVPVANSLHTVLLASGSGWTDIGLSKANQHGYAFPTAGDAFQMFAETMLGDVVGPEHLKKIAVLQDAGPQTGLVAGFVSKMAKQYGAKVVSVATTQPGSTDDTPQVLQLLKANPQAIVLGLIPGTDALTGLKAIRSQNTTIPVGVCPACQAASFVQGMGGASSMAFTYTPGSAPQIAHVPSKGDSEVKAIVQNTKTYLSALKGAHYTSSDDIDNDFLGWQSAWELGEGIIAAKSTDETKVMHALQHQQVGVGGQQGFYLKRTPNNYSGIVKVVAAVDKVTSSGSLKVFRAGAIG